VRSVAVVLPAQRASDNTRYSTGSTIQVAFMRHWIASIRRSLPVISLILRSF
jgi:hypothetical protein